MGRLGIRYLGLGLGGVVIGYQGLGLGGLGIRVQVRVEGFRLAGLHLCKICAVKGL